MIRFVRVDHRLLHGQIIYSWLKHVHCDTIFIINDNVASSASRKNALRLAKPAGMKLVMKSIDDAVEAINSGITEKYHLFIVVESIHDLHRLVMRVKGISTINLGGTIATAESNVFLPQINTTEANMRELKEISQKGIEIEYRLVPNDAKINVNKKLEGMNL